MTSNYPQESGEFGTIVTFSGVKRGVFEGRADVASKEALHGEAISLANTSGHVYIGVENAYLWVTESSISL